MKWFVVEIPYRCTIRNHREFNAEDLAQAKRIAKRRRYFDESIIAIFSNRDFDELKGEYIYNQEDLIAYTDIDNNKWVKA